MSKVAYEIENPNKQKPIGEIEIIVTYPPPEGSKFFELFLQYFQEANNINPTQSVPVIGKDGTLTTLSY